MTTTSNDSNNGIKLGISLNHHPVKIIAWSVKGLGNQKKTTTIKDIFFQNQPKIVLIQETLKQKLDKKCLSSFWGNHMKNWIATP